MLFFSNYRRSSLCRNISVTETKDVKTSSTEQGTHETVTIPQETNQCIPEINEDKNTVTNVCEFQF